MNRDELRKHEQIWLDVVQQNGDGAQASRLHGYAVGVVYDTLIGGGDVRIRTDAGISDNLLRGVTGVWLNTGDDGPEIVEADIALGDDSGNTIRIVEICGWGMPSKPADFIARMNRLDIEVVRSVELQGAADVAALVYRAHDGGPPNFAGAMPPSWVEKKYGYGSGLSQSLYDHRVVEIIQGILYCSPETRQHFKYVLDHLDSLESLAPLSADNPKRDGLDLDSKPNSLERIVAAGKDGGPDWAMPDWREDLHSGETYDAIRLKKFV